MAADLERSAKDVIPGYQKLWKYLRESDGSSIVYITSPLPVGTSFEIVHDMGRAVGLRRQGEGWLKYKIASRSWSKAGRADRKVLQGLVTMGSIPF